MGNAHTKEIWSYLLQSKIRVRLTAEAMKMIDECGGLDEYILLNDIEDLGGKSSAAACIRDVLNRELLRRNESVTTGLQFKARNYVEGNVDWRSLLIPFNAESEALKSPSEINPNWRRKHSHLIKIPVEQLNQ